MRVAIVVALAAATAGCGSHRPVHINRDVYTVAVLMPHNGSMYLEAPAKVWPFIEHEVAARGYRLVPRAVVQGFYASKRFTTGEEIEQYSAKELAQEFKCDALVYSNVGEWGATNLVVYTEVKVEVNAVLRDGRDGQVVWENEGADSSKAVARSWREAAGQTLNSMLASLEPYAERATRGCFGTLPLPGFEPKEEKPK